jgi:hypothetical protein
MWSMPPGGIRLDFNSVRTAGIGGDNAEDLESALWWGGRSCRLPGAAGAFVRKPADGKTVRPTSRSFTKPEIGYSRPQSGRLQEPDADDNDYYDIQNRFDTGGHRNIPVYQIQPHPNYDQHHDNIQQRHSLAPSIPEEQFAAQCGVGQAGDQIWS